MSTVEATTCKCTWGHCDCGRGCCPHSAPARDPIMQDCCYDEAFMADAQGLITSLVNTVLVLAKGFNKVRRGGGMEML